MEWLRKLSNGARSCIRHAQALLHIGQGAVGALALALATFAWAQQPIFYPAKGQSAQRQQTDLAECQGWAKQTTGVDPVALAQGAANAPPPPAQQGQRLRGAAGGAALGAAGGAIAGNAGTGAAIGALAGTAAGGMRQRQQAQASAQQQQAAQQNMQAQLATFNRAVTACMNGRGYTSQ